MIPRTALLAAALAAGTAAQIATPGQFDERRLRMPPGLGPAGPCLLVDLDGDGLQDLVRASGTVLAVLLQGPDGRFARDPRQPPIGFPAPATEITALAAGRVDADPFADVVVGIAGDHEVLLRGNGLGQLVIVTPNPIAASSPVDTSPSGIAIGNLDSANGNDLVIASSSGLPRVLYSDGAGGFFGPLLSPFPVAVRGPWRAFAAADFDGDRDLDLACSLAGSSDTILLESAGRQLSMRHTEPYAATQIVVGDFGVGPPTDLVLAHASSGALPVLLDNVGRFAFGTAVPLPWNSTVAPTAILAADLDGAAPEDLAILDRTGALLLSRGLQSPVRVLGPDARTALALGDLEGDGDRDLVVAGLRPPDAVLLGDGAGNFFDTERPVLVGDAILGRQVGVLVGRERARDPNLLVYDANGTPHYFDNDAGHRFTPHPGGVAPSLPGSGPAAIERAVLAPSGGDGFIALDPTRPNGVSFLSMNANQSVSDVTSVVFPTVGQWFTAVAVGRFGAPTTTNSTSDLVFADITGLLHLYRRGATAYAEVVGAFRGIAAFPGITGLLVGAFDGDNLSDLCVLHGGGATVLLGSSTGFAPGPPLPISTPVVAGEVLDVDGAFDDLLLVTPGIGQPLTMLRNHGGAVFLDETVMAFGGSNALPLPSDLVVTGAGDRLAIVLGTGPGRVLVASLAPTGSMPWFALAPLPLHGSGAIVDLVIGDVDGDLDDDLVVLRDGLPPHVLLNRELHLGSLAVGQVGRRLDLLLEGDGTDVAAVFLGFTPSRIEFEPFGILRLADPITLLTAGLAPDGKLPVALDLPVGLPRFELQLQLAVLRPLTGTAILGNLHRAAITHL